MKCLQIYTIFLPLDFYTQKQIKHYHKKLKENYMTFQNNS